MVGGVKAILLGLLTMVAVILGIGCGVSKAKHEKTVAELEKSVAGHKRTSAELEKVAVKLKEAVAREQTVKEDLFAAKDNSKILVAQRDQALAIIATLGLENSGDDPIHLATRHDNLRDFVHELEGQNEELEKRVEVLEGWVRHLGGTAPPTPS